MEQWQDDFIRYLRFEKRYAPHTVTAYRNDLTQFHTYITATYGTITPDALTHFHIRSWLTELKEQQAAATTINRKISTLHAFFRFLLKKKRIDRDPVRRVPAQKIPDRLPAFLKEQETKHLQENPGFEEGFKGCTERLICELLYQAGLRRNELQQLQESDIEWGAGQIRVLGKGNKERLLPLSTDMLMILKDYITQKKELVKTDNNHLLVLENGEPLYAMFIYRTVKKYLNCITTLKKKSPHILRHSFATHLLNNGANIQAIKELLGHSSLAATQVYTHNDIERLKTIHQVNHPRG